MGSRQISGSLHLAMRKEKKNSSMIYIHMYEKSRCIFRYTYLLHTAEGDRGVEGGGRGGRHIITYIHTYNVCT